MAELEEATPLQLEAMKKEGKTRAQLEKICCLYRFHYEENQSPTRERNLKKFSQRVDKVRKRLILILYIKGTTKITKQSSAEPTVDEIGEEEKESSDLGLIPYYFFEEKDDSDTDLSFQFHEIAKVIVNDFVKKNFVKLSEESLKQVQLTLTHKLLMGNCSSSIMNSSRCLFDRGKYKLNFDSKLRSPYFMGFQFLDRLYREIVQNLLYQSGYQSNGFSGDSIGCMLANEGFIATAWYMFGRMLECEIMRRLFDRGRDGSILLDRYTDEIVSNFIQWCRLEFLLVISNTFLIFIDDDNCYCEKLCRGTCLRCGFGFAQFLFDRGIQIESVERCFSYKRNILKFCVAPCLFVGNGLKFVEGHDGKYAYEYHFAVVIQSTNVVLFVKYGDHRDGSKMFEGSVFLLVKEIKNGDVSKLFDKEWQPCSVDWKMLIVQVAKGSWSANMRELFDQMLDKHISRHTQLKETWDVIIRQYNPLPLLTRYELILFTFGLWNVRHGGGTIWILIELPRSLDFDQFREVNNLKYSMGPGEVFVIILSLSAVKHGLSTFVKSLLLSLLYEPRWYSIKVESSEWMSSLNKVVENEAMEGGSLHSTRKLQDKIETKEVVKAVERALSAMGMRGSFLFSPIKFKLVEHDSWVLKEKSKRARLGTTDLREMVMITLLVTIVMLLFDCTCPHYVADMGIYRNPDGAGVCAERRKMSDLASGFATYKRKLYNAMAADSGKSIRSQLCSFIVAQMGIRIEDVGALYVGQLEVREEKIKALLKCTEMGILALTVVRQYFTCHTRVLGLSFPNNRCYRGVEICKRVMGIKIITNGSESITQQLLEVVSEEAVGACTQLKDAVLKCTFMVIQVNEKMTKTVLSYTLFGIHTSGITLYHFSCHSRGFWLLFCDKSHCRRVQLQERRVETKRGIREDKVYKMLSQMHAEVVGVDSCDTVGGYHIASSQRFPFLLLSHPASAYTVDSRIAIYHKNVTLVTITAILQMGLARVNIISNSKLMRGYIQVISKEHREQHEGSRDLQIKLSSVEVTLAFPYWLAAQSWPYDVVVFMVMGLALFLMDVWSTRSPRIGSRWFQQLSLHQSTLLPGMLTVYIKTETPYGFHTIYAHVLIKSVAFY